MLVKEKRQVTEAQNKCLKLALLVWLKEDAPCNTVDILSAAERSMDTESPHYPEPGLPSCDGVQTQDR